MDTGNTAWVLISAALVLFMTPGLALLLRRHGPLEERARHADAERLRDGPARRRSGSSIAFSLAFGDAGNGGVIGNFDFAFLKDVDARAPRPASSSASSPSRSCCSARYQMTFAIITPALITGATADRLKFSAYAVVHRRLVGASSTARSRTGCSPAASSPNMGALDFAGGAVVHINAGAAALALRPRARRPRRGYPDTPMPPHNLPLDHARHRHPVVRLGRLQRRLGARRRRRGGAGAS